ncbi:MAG: SRPBCC family protein [Ignavibacteriales bacterium]|nr:SRPBCC family protein [Ignavibacteriales bacterium]
MKKSEQTVSIPINVTPEAAWNVIGAVGGVDKWFAPVIRTCRVDGNKRHCTTDAGGFTEDILKVDHVNREFHYAIPEQNMVPVKNIVGMMKVWQGENGMAVIDWHWKFDVEEETEAQAKEMLAGAGQMGISGIEKLILSGN